jgi:hypothetical protein
MNSMLGQGFLTPWNPAGGRVFHCDFGWAARGNPVKIRPRTPGSYWSHGAASQGPTILSQGNPVGLKSA